MRYALINAGVVQNVIVATDVPVVPGSTVLPLSPNQAAGPGDSWDGTTFTPRVPTPAEVTRAAVPGKLIGAYPTLRQWAIDATALWTATAARAQTPAESREVLRRLGILMDGLADLLAYQHLDNLGD